MTVQQLDKNMSNLRTWLSRVEAELAEPVVYEVCHADEIQRKLSEQQVQFQRRSWKTSESCLKTGLHSAREQSAPLEPGRGRKWGRFCQVYR